MVPLERLAFESYRTESYESDQRDHLLDNLQLDQAERSSIIAETDPVGWNLEAIFEKRQEPAEEDYTDQGQMLEPTELLFELKVPIPGTRHEYVGNDQHQNRVKTLHILFFFGEFNLLG